MPPPSPGSDVRDGDPGEMPLQYTEGAPRETEATFVTSMGSFTARLMPEHAPKTVATSWSWRRIEGMDRSARREQRDRPALRGTIFHRVIDNFMIQGATLRNGHRRPGYTLRTSAHEGPAVRPSGAPSRWPTPDRTPTAASSS